MESPQEEIADWHQSRQPQIYGLSAMFLFLASSAVCLRCLAAVRMSGKLLFEDLMMVLALILSWIIAVVYIWDAAKYGLGLHFYRVLAQHPPADIISMFRTFWVTAVLTAPWIYSIKLSLLFYYRRIFIHQTGFKWAWWANMIFATGWVIGATIYYVLQCDPPQYYWEKYWLFLKIQPPYPVHGICAGGAGKRDEISSSMPLIVSLISDLGILALPMFVVSQLRMSLRRRLGVHIIFGVGAMACVCEILRIWSDATADSQLKGDPTYGSVTFVILNVAEGNTAILAGCMPQMVSQYRHVRSRFGDGSLKSHHLLSFVSLRRFIIRIRSLRGRGTDDSPNLTHVKAEQAEAGAGPSVIANEKVEEKKKRPFVQHHARTVRDASWSLTHESSSAGLTSIAYENEDNDTERGRSRVTHTTVSHENNE